MNQQTIRPARPNRVLVVLSRENDLRNFVELTSKIRDLPGIGLEQIRRHPDGTGSIMSEFVSRDPTLVMGRSLLSLIYDLPYQGCGSSRLTLLTLLKLGCIPLNSNKLIKRLTVSYVFVFFIVSPLYVVVSSK